MTGDPDLASFETLTDADHDAIRNAWDDPILFDAALNEGGLFALFMHERHALLPEDEQLLAASWTTVERSVHELVAVEVGVGMTLRDLATGEVVEVRDRSASTQLEVGQRICARVVPDGVGNQIVGGVFPVRTGFEETVLELCAQGDPHELCAWAGLTARPPTIVHKPGMIDSMFDTHAIQGVIDALGDGANDAEITAAISAEAARQAQARWLDEHIPALGGLTPREAAADPTRREQLERLLNEFERPSRTLSLAKELPEGSTPFGYDVAALRRELGLI